MRSQIGQPKIFTSRIDAAGYFSNIREGGAYFIDEKGIKSWIVKGLKDDSAINHALKSLVAQEKNGTPITTDDLELIKKLAQGFNKELTQEQIDFRLSKYREIVDEEISSGRK